MYKMHTQAQIGYLACFSMLSDIQLYAGGARNAQAGSSRLAATKLPRLACFPLAEKKGCPSREKLSDISQLPSCCLPNALTHMDSFSFSI